jgi:hypothetical protein
MANKEKSFTLRFPLADYEYMVKQARYKDIKLAEYIRWIIDRGQRCNCDKTYSKPGTDW